LFRILEISYLYTFRFTVKPSPNCA
jgi:hypothetical protein